MDIHIHNHYPDIVPLAEAIKSLATAIRNLAESQQPSAELINVVKEVKAQAKINDDLIPDQ
jgi:hypothetical protein